MSYYLSRLIKGNFLSLSPGQKGLEFKNPFFCVISFYIADISELFYDDDKISDFEKPFHLNYIIDNVMTELFETKGFDIYTTEMDNLTVSLVNFSEKSSASEILQLANEGVNFINDNFEILLTFALSKPHKGIVNIPQAYEQTLQVLDYKRILEIVEPMVFSEITYTSKNRYGFSFLKEQALLHSIKAGDLKNALDIINKVFENLSNNKNLPPDYITYVVLDIASTVTKSANEIMAENFNFETELTLYRNIKNNESLLNLKSQINQYIEMICDNINSDLENKKNKTQQLVKKILQYADENFTNVDLNITTIGYHFNLTPSYVSRIFKEEISVSLADYINMKRINKSQKLSESGLYSIKEISQMVGFANDRTYYRIKKRLGKQQI